MPSKIQLDENLWFLYTCLQNSDMKLVCQSLFWIKPNTYIFIPPNYIPFSRSACPSRGDKQTQMLNKYLCYGKEYELTISQIDFQAVAQAANIKSPAARMRYTRLKKQIEDGTLIGTRGTAFSPLDKKRSGATSKRGVGNKKSTQLNDERTGSTTKSVKANKKDQAKKQEDDDEEDGLNTLPSSLPLDAEEDKKNIFLAKLQKYDPESPPVVHHSTHPATTSKRWPPPFVQSTASGPSRSSSGNTMANGGGTNAKESLNFGRPWAPGVLGVDVPGLKRES
jgi:hypothetical protein